MTENVSFIIYKTYVANKKLQSFLHVATLEFHDQCTASGASLKQRECLLLTAPILSLA